MKNLYLIASLLASPIIFSQSIVNIENLRYSGELGEFKSVGISLNGSRGNEDRDDYKLNLSFTKNNEDIESLLTFNHSERTKGDALEDKSSFFHGRLLFKSDNLFDYEVYLQSSKNPFQSYKKRDLFGIGLRFDLNEMSKIGLSLFMKMNKALRELIKKQIGLIYIYTKR